MRKILKITSILFILILCSKELEAQNYKSSQQLVAQDKDEDGRFGEEVFMYGKCALVGARYSERDFSGSIPSTKAGAAYLFERDSLGDWRQIQKFSAWDREQFDEFGAAIIMDSNYIVIGSPKEDDDEIAINTRNLAGSVYIYKRNGNNWTYQQKIVASDRDGGDNFGSSVAIWNDYIIVGAPNEDNNIAGINGFANAGSVYFFKLNNSTNTWNEIQKVVPSDRAVGDNFGYEVLFANGDAIISSPGNSMLDTGGVNTVNNAGSVYSFRLDTANNWTEMQQFSHPDRNTNDSLGVSISAWRNELIAGSPYQDLNNQGSNTLNNSGAAYYFKQDSLLQWQFIQKVSASDRKSNSQFGKSVSIYDQSIIIGAPFEINNENDSISMTDAGAAYVFNRNGSQWIESQKLVAFDRDTSDNFGWAASTFNNKFVIGAYTKDYLPWFPQWHNEVGSIFFMEECITPSITQSGLTLTAQSSSGNFQWLNCNNGYAILPNDTLQTYTVSSNGSYAVEIRKNGCIDTSACLQVIGVGLEELQTSSISVFPNPTEEVLTINTKEQFEFRVFDIKGTLQNVKPLNKQRLDLSNLASGIYFLELILENDTKRIKLIKK